jgi:hypothetical protein
MPLQSLAQRTVGYRPCGWRRPSEVGGMGLDVDFTAAAEASACRLRRLWLGARWPLHPNLERFVIESSSRHASPWKTRTGSRGPSQSGCPKAAFPVGTPLMGFIKDRPSTDINTLRPLPVEPKPDLRPEAATPQACSVLAVSHDSDGLRRKVPRRFVAPCCRPWGSPCFQPVSSALAG